MVSEAADSVSPSDLWEAFKASVEAEMSWLFRELDPIGEAMTPALRKMVNLTGTALDGVMPENHAKSDQYVSAAIVANAAKRQVALRGNRPSLRMLLARVIWFLGGGKRVAKR